MTSVQPPVSRKDVRIAIVCALPREADAVCLLFDHLSSDGLGRANGDANTYINGNIGAHHVVLVILPSMGVGSAAAAAASLRSSYINLNLVLLVGVCGGVPNVAGSSAFLGDVVVSRTITQYRYGRQYPGHFAVKNTIDDNLGRASKDIRSLLALCETQFMRRQLQKRSLSHLIHLQEAAEKEGYKTCYRYPGSEADKLYASTYLHSHQNGCDICASEAKVLCEQASQDSCIKVGCDAAHLVVRHRAENLAKGGNFTPKILIGRVGSGDTVMKSGEDRDRIASEHGLIAFEMEGAGAWDEVPCIVVKGICDYADSHKNKDWQDFAAATAASVAKAILARYPVQDVDPQAVQTNGSPTPTGRTITGNSFGNQAFINQGDVGGNITFGVS